KVSHYAPLHYVTHIVQTHSLKSKKALISDGFEESHFRSKSRSSDVQRGFEEYVFMTLEDRPRILMAKLKRGFPHVAIEVPVEAFENTEYHLCRYNVAMTRRLRRDGMPGWPENDNNGRYYGTKQIPIAITNDDKNALLLSHYGQGTMIEVLVPSQFSLPHNTKITCYHSDDTAIARRILDSYECTWTLSEELPGCLYHRNDQYVTSVINYISHALESPDWRGNGLEFDNV
ncbi:MAG: hypothetical protein OXU23_16230, partial [Candidatus Poribacteria bacterium]|nr:hypothetical protein [Candidatus Poribacteria bacterium]